MKTLSVSLALVVLGLGAAPAAAQGITFKQALKEAQSSVPDGTLLFGRFEPHNPPVWGFYFLTRKKTVIEIEIKGNGKVGLMHDLSPKQTAQKFDAKLLDAVNSVTRAKLPFGEFLEIAADQAKGDPTGVQIVMADGQLVVEVTVGNTPVRISVTTGQVIKG